MLYTYLLTFFLSQKRVKEYMYAFIININYSFDSGRNSKKSGRLQTLELPLFNPYLYKPGSNIAKTTS